MASEGGAAERERTVRLTREDIERFAAASADVNPLHVDPAFARRTPFGGCVVHGALVAIAMLGTLADAERRRVRALRAWFAGPVIPGAPARVTALRSKKAEELWELKLTARGRTVARLVAGPSAEHIAPRLAAAAGSGAPLVPMRTSPAARPLDQLVAGYRLHGEYRTAHDLVGLAADVGAGGLDRTLLDGLAWVSYVVGMEVPGLHSLLSGLTLAAQTQLRDRPAGAYEIEVRDHDLRTGALDISGVLTDQEGGRPLLAAKIEAFSRSPVAGPDPALLGVAHALHADLPERGRAIVIGASRGFGAALSLALAARGYEVHGAHSSHVPDAERPTAAGRLSLHALDAREPAQMATLAGIAAAAPGGVEGLVLNAALAPLAMGLTAESAADLAAYVAASVELAAVPLGAILPLLRSDGWVVFCSSSALSTPPRDWPHYVAAKAALEGLASWVAQTSPRLRTVILRPPAMRTEMTNTPTGAIAAVPAETIAIWVADRIAEGRLPAGLSMLEPGR
jgi:NAD(P)-dependent dehydrogenase (short-subunit alcohol dehydrogenase family)/acyl dehydratase